ncbi:MAG: hypothetical protein M1820_010020 [Bogoriella megaspora]|nr:MAG: hypothetical protein M1820_010020 [Bogoriella megaspora]
MAEANGAPQLDNSTGNEYPNLSPSGSSLQNAKNSVYNESFPPNHRKEDDHKRVLIVATGAQSAMDAAKNHPLTQSIRDGPVAENVRNQAAKTSTDFNNLASTRRTPDVQTANGQPLTHYHSLFYSLLSWENPRATAISYIAIASLIFAARYLNVLRFVFKGICYALGATASAEVAGKLVLGQGFASQIRPRRYFTIPRESLERVLEDVEQLINFFVIEFQRILFAENVWATIAAFFAAFVSYWLIKIVPTWGLALTAITTVYFAPLVYIQNRELIDGHLDNASSVVTQQTSQFRDLAAHHTGRATDSLVQATKGYTAKAQEYMGQKGSGSTNGSVAGMDGHSEAKQDFPSAPSHEPQAPEYSEPLKSEPIAE